MAQERDEYGRFKAKRGKVYHSVLNKWSDEGAIAEYNRLRSIALKRNKRAVKTRNAKPLQLPTAKQIGDIKTIRIKVEQLSDKLNQSTSTVLGEKQMIQKSVKALRKKGFKFLNKKNYKSFGRFMKKMREEYDIVKGTMSERLVEIFNLKKEYKQNYDDIIENFNIYLNNTSKLSKQVTDNKKGVAEQSNKEYLEELIGKGEENDYILKARRIPKDERRNRKKKRRK